MKNIVIVLAIAVGLFLGEPIDPPVCQSPNPPTACFTHPPAGE